jgi:hypothetical protein
MAKGNQKYQRQGIEKEQAKIGGEYDSFMNQFLGRSQGPTATSGSVISRMKGEGANTTGSAVPRFGESSNYKDLQAAGDEERGYLTKGYRDFAETGGLGDDDYNRIRDAYSANIGGPANAELSDFTDVNKRYTDFADTGGYSGGDIQRIRAQAASAAPAFYGAMKDQMNLRRATQGSNASANAGVDFKLARQQAQGAAANRLGANIGLAESQRAGKQFGIQGLESTATTTGNQNIANAGRLDDFGIRRGSIMGNAEMGIADMKQGGKKFGLSGASDLYRSDYAPIRGFEANWLNAVGASGDATRGNRQLQLSNDEINRSRMMENIIGMTGAVAGGMTGLGALRGKG